MFFIILLVYWRVTCFLVVCFTGAFNVWLLLGHMVDRPTSMAVIHPWGPVGFKGKHPKKSVCAWEYGNTIINHWILRYPVSKHLLIAQRLDPPSCSFDLTWGAVEVTYGYNHGYVEPPTVGRTPILRNIFHSKWTLQEVQRFNRQPSQKIWKIQVEKKHGWHGSSKKVYIHEKTQCDLNVQKCVFKSGNSMAWWMD